MMSIAMSGEGQQQLAGINPYAHAPAELRSGASGKGDV